MRFERSFSDFSEILLWYIMNYCYFQLTSFPFLKNIKQYWNVFFPCFFLKFREILEDILEEIRDFQRNFKFDFHKFCCLSWNSAKVHLSFEKEEERWQRSWKIIEIWNATERLVKISKNSVKWPRCRKIRRGYNRERVLERVWKTYLLKDTSLVIFRRSNGLSTHRCLVECRVYLWVVYTKKT